jgi:hypothetical protein
MTSGPAVQLGTAANPARPWLDLDDRCNHRLCVFERGIDVGVQRPVFPFRHLASPILHAVSHRLPRGRYYLPAGGTGQC